jgi:hypothetical protein
VEADTVCRLRCQERRRGTRVQGVPPCLDPPPLATTRGTQAATQPLNALGAFSLDGVLDGVPPRTGRHAGRLPRHAYPPPLSCCWACGWHPVTMMHSWQQFGWGWLC